MPPAVLRAVPSLALAPVPLLFLQPLLSRFARHAAQAHPELFERLGPHVRSRYLIDPQNLPFVLLLQPHPQRPQLIAYRRGEKVRHDAMISGSLLTLLDMIDAGQDGDALFFNRGISISGNTDAIVTLRNALDDMDGSIVDTLVNTLHPISAIVKPMLAMYRKTRRTNHG